MMSELGIPQPLDRSEEIIATVVVRQTIGPSLKAQKETDFKLPQIFSLFALVLAIGLVLPLIATFLNPTVVTVLSKTVPFLLGAVFIGKLESIRDRLLSIAAKKWLWIGI